MRLRTPAALAAGALFALAPACLSRAGPGPAADPAAGITGGAGGTPVVVTTLADAGEGSLREALSGGQRIVTFGVCGRIRLSRPLQIEHDDITVDGSTAPCGQGVQITDEAIRIRARNVILRQLDLRLGEGSRSPWSTDPIEISASDRILLDHLSVAWGTDELLSIHDYDGPVGRVVVRDSLFYEALRSPAEGRVCSDVPKKPCRDPARDCPGAGARCVGRHHAFGPLVTGRVAEVVFLRNVFAALDDRVPRVNGADRGRGLTRVRMLDNLLYGTRYGLRLGRGGGRGSPAWRIEADVVGNVMRGHPEARSLVEVTPGTPQPITVYLRDNFDSRRRSPVQPEARVCRGPCRLREEPHAPLPPLVPARDLVARLLAEAGNTRPCRDAADRRVLAAISRGRALPVIDQTAEVGGFPDLRQACAVAAPASGAPPPAPRLVEPVSGR